MSETHGQKMIRLLESHYSHGKQMMHLLEQYRKELEAKKSQKPKEQKP